LNPLAQELKLELKEVANVIVRVELDLVVQSRAHNCQHIEEIAYFAVLRHLSFPILNNDQEVFLYWGHLSCHKRIVVLENNLELINSLFSVLGGVYPQDFLALKVVELAEVRETDDLYDMGISLVIVRDPWKVVDGLFSN
jgi:hypothetical protein